jgi:predicted phage tail protein
VESKSNFTVVKGEEAPEMGDCGPVTGIAQKQCNMTIPYKVEGEKQSDLEIIIEKDGKVLKIGKDINLTLHGDRIQLDVINPKREKSGKYKVTMRNAQGSCEKWIDVNIMDKPTPPQSCRVSDVYQDNCIVHWTPPADDGGTPIKKYVVECLDTTTGNGNWAPVASTEDGGAKKIKVNNLTPMHRYRFRVRAVNKIGESDPCEMKGDDILAKDPWGKLFTSRLQIIFICWGYV